MSMVRRWATIGALALAVSGCGGSDGTDREQARTATVEVGRNGGDGGAPDRHGQPQLPGDEACPNSRQPTNRGNLRESEIAVRCLTNAARRRQGLAELRFDERLARAAADRSQAMADANFFGHDGPGESNVRTAIATTGWIPEGGSWLVGENIGWAEGRATPARMVRSWLDSPRHRRNILSEHFTQIGVGAVAAVPKKGARPGATFTQVFGATGDAAREAQTK